MSTQTVALHHVVEGPDGAPAVLLGASLGTTLEMWDTLAARLRPTFRVVRFDTRGHGGTPAPPGPYTLTALAADVVGLADRLGIDRFGYAGLSLGGAIGQTLALEHPGRVSALALLCTGARLGDPYSWLERAARVKEEGLGWLVEPTTERWFTPGFPAAEPAAAKRLLDMLTAADPVGYAGCCEALAGFDVGEKLDRIDVPTLVVAGAEDPVTPPASGKELAEGIPGARLLVVEGASHQANAEQPGAVDTAVLEHLEKHR